METEKSVNKFSSLYGFLITAIGFAVGVGTIWRFPYMLGENGGALFFLAYIGIIAIIGIPLLAAEITMGYKSQKSAILAYKTLAPGKPWFLGGYMHLAAGLLIISYTLPIYAWILKYLVATIAGDFRGLDATGVASYFGGFISNHPVVAIFAIVNIGLNALIVSFGSEKGIERITKILMPTLGIIMIILIFAGIRLPGSMEGVKFLVLPDPSKFTIGSLQAALGQAFFAIGIGMLASMVFGSYIKKENKNIGQSAVIICSSLVVAGILAGFMLFPVLFANGIEPAAGPSLTFIVLPNVFNQIPGGFFMGILFYIGFYIAAITSSAGVLEAVIGLFMDQFNMSRKKALAVALSIMTAVGMLCIFNDAIFNLADIVENNYLLTLGALCISIFVGWVWGIDKFIAATNVKSNVAKIWLKVTVKYVSPLVILFIFISAFF